MYKAGAREWLRKGCRRFGWADVSDKATSKTFVFEFIHLFMNQLVLLECLELLCVFNDFLSLRVARTPQLFLYWQREVCNQGNRLTL